MPSVRRDVRPPGGRLRCHQVGHPVPGRERRVDPLNDRHRGAGPAGYTRGDVGESLTQRGHEKFCFPRGAGMPSDDLDRLQNLVESVRIRRDDIGGAAQIVQRIGNLARRQRADPAQVLGEDELRGQRRERASIEVYRSFPAASCSRT